MVIFNVRIELLDIGMRVKKTQQQFCALIIQPIHLVIIAEISLLIESGYNWYGSAHHTQEGLRIIGNVYTNSGRGHSNVLIKILDWSKWLGMVFWLKLGSHGWIIGVYIYLHNISIFDRMDHTKDYFLKLRLMSGVLFARCSMHRCVPWPIVSLSRNDAAHTERKRHCRRTRNDSIRIDLSRTRGRL